MNPHKLGHVIGCPECGMPAEVLGVDEWPSTDGPVTHFTVLCVNAHRFNAPADSFGAPSREVAS